MRGFSLQAFVGFAACVTTAVLTPLTLLFVRSMIHHPTIKHFITLLFLWQTIITGGLAILAAVIGALAAVWVVRTQLIVAEKKERLKAHCLAIAIAPELLYVKIDFERASRVISEGLYLAKKESWATAGIVDLILTAQIDLPPLLSQSVQQLYLLENTGAHLLQMTSVTLQYNQLVKNLSENIRTNIDGLDPSAHQKALSGHLRVIEKNIADAERLIETLHDGAEKN